MSRRRSNAHIQEHEDLLIVDDTLIITINYERPSPDETQNTGYQSLLSQISGFSAYIRKIRTKIYC